MVSISPLEFSIAMLGAGDKGDPARVDEGCVKNTSFCVGAEFNTYEPATIRLLTPAATATARMVLVLDTARAPVYGVEEEVGRLPSVV